MVSAKLRLPLLIAFAATLCAAVIFFSASRSIVSTPIADEQSRTVRILFVGNSLTYYNELPSVLSYLVQSSLTGVALETRMIATGGATLESLWYDGEARDAIRDGDWDYVVLQEQGSLGGGSFNGRSAVNSPDLFHAFAALFDREIRAAGAKTALLLTWAPVRAPERQPLLDFAYLQAAKELDAILLPVGIAWQKAIASEAAPNLYSDGGHPSFAGTYLAATVIGAQFFGSDGFGLENAGEHWCCVTGPSGQHEYGSEDLERSHKLLFNTVAREAVEEGRERLDQPLPTPPVFDVLDIQRWLDENSAASPSRVSIDQFTGSWSGELNFVAARHGTLTIEIVDDESVRLAFTTTDGTEYNTRPMFWQSADNEFRIYDPYTHILYRFRPSDAGLVGVAERLLQQQDNSAVSTFSLSRIQETE